MDEPNQARKEVALRCAAALRDIDPPPYAAPSKLYELIGVKLVPCWLPYRWATRYRADTRELLYDPTKAGHGRYWEQTIGKRLVDLICRSAMSDHLEHCAFGYRLLALPEEFFDPMLEEFGLDLPMLGKVFWHATFQGLADRIVDLREDCASTWVPDNGLPERTASLESGHELARELERQMLLKLQSGSIGPGRTLSKGTLVVHGWRAPSFREPGWQLLTHRAPVQLHLIPPAKTLSPRPPRVLTPPPQLTLVPSVAAYMPSAAPPAPVFAAPPPAPGLYPPLDTPQELAAEQVDVAPVVPTAPPISAPVLQAEPVAPSAEPKIAQCGSRVVDAELDSTGRRFSAAPAATEVFDSDRSDFILLLVAEERTDREIAARMQMPVGAVRAYVESAQSRAGVKNRVALIRSLHASSAADGRGERSAASHRRWAAQPIVETTEVRHWVPDAPVVSSRVGDTDFDMERSDRILGLLAEGCTDKEIAARARVPLVTVQAYVEHAQIQAGARNRAALIEVARRALMT